MMIEIEQLVICLCVAVVAFLYASVGHGGATGYLAVLSLFGFAPVEMASTALILNILVAGLAFATYARAGYFRWRMTWPFLITSIPFAFLGGLLPLRPGAYDLILAGALMIAAWRLTLMPENLASESNNGPPLWAALIIGSFLGLVSGIIGIGGGIFLSPVILLLGWTDLKTTSATSALFIVANALAGLGGRLYGDTFALGNLLPFLLAAGVGGLLGARLGAFHWSGKTLKRLLAVVLVMAAFKLAFHRF